MQTEETLRYTQETNPISFRYIEIEKFGSELFTDRVPVVGGFRIAIN